MQMIKLVNEPKISVVPLGVSQSSFMFARLILVHRSAQRLSSEALSKPTQENFYRFKIQRGILSRPFLARAETSFLL